MNAADNDSIKSNDFPILRPEIIEEATAVIISAQLDTITLLDRHINTEIMYNVKKKPN